MGYKHKDKIIGTVLIGVLIEWILLIIMGTTSFGDEVFGIWIGIVALFVIIRIRKLAKAAKLEKRINAIREREKEGKGTHTPSSTYTSYTDGPVSPPSKVETKTSLSGAALQSQNASANNLKAYFSRIKRLASEFESKSKRQKFGSFSSIMELSERLRAYAQGRGIVLSEETTREILTAMASSRCIFVKKTAENTEDILCVIEGFFTGLQKNCCSFGGMLIKPMSLMYSFQDGAPKETDFFKSVYAASFLTNNVAVCALKGVERSKFSYIFSDFIKLFRRPMAEVYMTLTQLHGEDVPKVQDGKMRLPNNLWCFFLVEDEINDLPADSALWSTTLELRGEGVATESAETFAFPIAFAQFNELIEGTFDEYFAPLDVWKKFDRVEEYLHTSIGFSVDNILARQIERLTTMYTACGNTSVQAMDMAIARKILPMLKGCTREQINHEGSSLRELLEGLFGADNIPECLHTLAALGLD